MQSRWSHICARGYNVVKLMYIKGQVQTAHGAKELQVLHGYGGGQTACRTIGPPMVSRMEAGVYPIQDPSVPGGSKELLTRSQ